LGPDAGCNLLVFRAGKHELSGRGLLQAFLYESRVGTAADKEWLTTLLLRAGELECALADSDHSRVSAAIAAVITDEIADALLGAELDRARVESLAHRLEMPPRLAVSAPEGFCYYALHPLDYAALLRTFNVQTRSAAVVGIRSIGTTLSAVVSAELRRQGKEAQRISVRPVGHPFDRELAFTPEQREWIHRRPRGARFFVVDEGPGLSGSSFLAVAEALEGEGISREQITILCSHPVAPENLCAREAARRCSRFEWRSVAPSQVMPLDAAENLSGGAWRNELLLRPEYTRTLYADTNNWPATWAWMEPQKYLSQDGSALYKYEGLGRYGAAVRDRVSVCAAAGFAIAPEGAAAGYAHYPLLPLRLLQAQSINAQMLERMGDYCAFRAQAFRVADADAAELTRMMVHNTRELLGVDLEGVQLEVSQPAICDARMMPHEWAVGSGMRLLKLDCGQHGDNHFYPGAADIAWDLAGAVIEWQLDAHATDALLAAYERSSGDNARDRLLLYLIAYSAFQAGYARVAAASMSGMWEQSLLVRDEGRYLRALERWCSVLNYRRHMSIAV
jgi:hypothetical protein